MSDATGSRTNEDVERLLVALKTVASCLKADGVPFALAGGYAVYARGGHASLHDVDFVVPGDHIPAVVSALERRGIEIERPPEDWLIKAWYDGQLIDIIHTLAAGPVDAELLGRAEEMAVESIRMPVLAATDLLVGKLLALSDHHCDLEPSVAIMRSLREQIDVPTVVSECRGHPFAEAGLFLGARLGLFRADVLDLTSAVDDDVRAMLEVSR